MGSKDPESLNADLEVFSKLAEDLGAEISAETILSCLKTLNLALNARQPAESKAAGLAFMHAGGLDTLTVLLRGIATSDSQADADSMCSDISSQAGEALRGLFESNGREAVFPERVVPQLIDALRDAPGFLGRLVAAQGLCALAVSMPAARRIIADVGTMRLALAFLVDALVVVWDKKRVEPAWNLAHVLLRCETAAVHDLQHAICGPDVNLAWITLQVLIVRYHPCRLDYKPKQSLSLQFQHARQDVLVAQM
jgi:hypothetical protein